LLHGGGDACRLTAGVPRQCVYGSLHIQSARLEPRVRAFAWLCLQLLRIADDDAPGRVRDRKLQPEPRRGCASVCRLLRRVGICACAPPGTRASGGAPRPQRSPAPWFTYLAIRRAHVYRGNLDVVVVRDYLQHRYQRSIVGVEHHAPNRQHCAQTRSQNHPSGWHITATTGSDHGQRPRAATMGSDLHAVQAPVQDDRVAAASVHLFHRAGCGSCDQDAH